MHIVSLICVKKYILSSLKVWIKNLRFKSWTDFKGPDSDDNIDDWEDEFDSDEEKDEHEPMPIAFGL